MEKEFVPYVLSKQIKQLGFNEECFGYYVDVEVANPFLVINRISNTQGGYFTLAPLWQQAFGWFREKYKIECYVNSYWNENDSSKRTYYANYNYGSDIFYTIPKEFETHEEAELECLKKLIEIVKDGRS